VRGAGAGGGAGVPPPLPDVVGRLRNRNADPALSGHQSCPQCGRAIAVGATAGAPAGAAGGPVVAGGAERSIGMGGGWSSRREALSPARRTLPVAVLFRWRAVSSRPRAPVPPGSTASVARKVAPLKPASVALLRRASASGDSSLGSMALTAS